MTNPVHLVMVTAENNNKFYDMFPGGSSFTVKYGRIGNTSFQTKVYPNSKWDSLYRQKVSKGYVDQTHLIAEAIEIKKAVMKEYAPIANSSVREIVDRLQSMAKQTVRDNYKISSGKVTEKMIKEAEELIVQLSYAKTVSSFNDLLLELFSVIPRKMSNVRHFLSSNTSDFSKIISREQSLLDVMKGQVTQNKVAKEKHPKTDIDTEMTILEAMGIEIEECDAEDIKIIKSKLRSCSSQFKKAWRVVNKKTQARFDKFVESENIKEKKLLWHGSRNENWWSIINAGLVLRPTNAIITGKMFGMGIYFATKARKSIGYTSLSGSYWAGGRSNSAFMGLYDVAYGTPYRVYDFNSRFYNFDYKKLQLAKSGANCLHADSSKGMLRNDEIILYQEDQLTIKYLVELTN